MDATAAPSGHNPSGERPAAKDHAEGRATGRPGTAARSDAEVVADAWRDDRRRLLDIAFRMLGSVPEAEDVVQEAFARLVRADVGAIDDVTGWLVVVASRLCIDRSRSTRRHPVSSTTALPGVEDGAAAAGAGPAPGVDPADRVTLDDSVRLGMHLVLERLSAAERTAFVLHDVFQYPFDEVAEIVGRTPAACRQLASRARRTIRDGSTPARFPADAEAQHRVTEEFIAACADGDIARLLRVLDPDVTGEADVGGAIGTVVVTGRDLVVERLLVFIGPATGSTLLSLPVPGAAGVVAVDGNRIVMMARLTIADGVITAIHSLADPTRLAALEGFVSGDR